MSELLSDFIFKSAYQCPKSIAVSDKKQSLCYLELARYIDQLSVGLQLSQAGERVAVYLPKQLETVVALFAAVHSGGVMVPINPQLKHNQVNHIINDCNASILITSSHRWQQIEHQVLNHTQVGKIFLIDKLFDSQSIVETDTEQVESPRGLRQIIHWQFSQVSNQPIEASDLSRKIFRRIDQDLAALMYTSGSTGMPKGVMLTHANMVAGAKSVTEYLSNTARDKILAVLPFSFDYGLSQLTTAFYVGAEVVLLEYLLPKDVIKAVERHQITGLACVPPLWIALAKLDWKEAGNSLRYWTNSGGAMPTSILSELRQQLPNATPFLMYGLTEAFRSTFLDPSEIETRPNSIGKAIPNAEILLINQAGERCGPQEKGELVHRGIHVAKGYWNAPEKTAERFKPLPPSLASYPNEVAVFSGDLAYTDEQGFIYFVGRNDEMIKSSGYRISPAEIEELVLKFSQVHEVAAIGVPHYELGQAVVLAVSSSQEQDINLLAQTLLKQCKSELPNFMHPKHIEVMAELPKNPNGKIDRKRLLDEFSGLFQA